MQTMMQDLRHGLRALRRAPGFTLVAVLTLALGIASTTLVFSVANAVLLRPLPYPQADRLVMIWGTVPDVRRTPVSVPNFLDYRERGTAFEEMAAFTSADGILNEEEEPERVRVGVVTAGFFPTLATEPALGRGFREGEDQEGRGNVVILSHGLWERRFAGSASAIGEEIRINSKPYTIIGVMPESFDFEVPGYFRPVDLWTPLALSQDLSRSTNFLRVIARLKPGVSSKRAEDDLARVSRELAREYPETNRAVGTRVVSLREQVVGDVRPTLLVLLGAVAFVFLVACANVASLELERATLRQREIGLRRALGAGTGRLVRSLVVESLLLGGVAGGLGILFAVAGMKLLEGAPTGHLSLGVPQLAALPVLSFTVAAALVAGLLTGLAPLVRVRTASLGTTLREGGRSSSGGVVTGRLRDLLVVLAFSFSLVLLTGSGLLIESFIHLLGVSPGFDPDHVVVAMVQLPSYAYESSAARLGFFRRAVRHLGSLPGVVAVAGIDDLPLTSDRDADGFYVEGRQEVTASELPVAQMRAVTSGYFRAMGIPVVEGRGFTESDRETAPAVVAINRTLARRFFPSGEDPVGKRLRIGEGPGSGWSTIVGVVGDVRDLGLEVEPEPEIYRPFAQAVVPYISLVVRTSLDPGGLIPLVRSEFGSLDRSLPAIAPTTMEQIFGRAMADRRFNMFLISVFALVALTLAAVGMYGVISFWATQRTSEIGVRIALGASRSDVARLVMGRGAVLAGVSVLVGLILSLVFARLISALVFEVSVSDPRVLAGVSIVLGLVAMIACWIPARRATSVDPVVALRHQ